TPAAASLDRISSSAPGAVHTCSMTVPAFVKYAARCANVRSTTTPVPGAPGTAAASATGPTVSSSPSRPNVDTGFRAVVVTPAETSAGTGLGTSLRRSAALHPPIIRNDQRILVPFPATFPVVDEQSDPAVSAPADQALEVLASAPGTGVQPPEDSCALRSDSVMPPDDSDGTDVPDSGASMLTIDSWHGQPDNGAVT